MVSELDLARGLGFKPPLCNLFGLKVYGGLYRFFESPWAGVGLHMREGVKDMIFILNSNPTSLSF